ncbi:MAG TPA: DUF2855 family protein [Polyangiales bacterium]
MKLCQLAVHHADPRRHTLQSGLVRDPLPGEILLEIELFGLSANNVTYAALGRQLPYHRFFPIDDEFSALPVWGVGRVLASRKDELPEGTRVYGYYPAASHATFAISAINRVGALVGRPDIPPDFAFYNQYSVAGNDPLYLTDREPWMVVLRPLFLTGLLLADYLTQTGYQEARAVLISSAASKTAYGLALALRAQGSISVIGIASASSRAAAEALGIYDAVFSYDQLTLDRNIPMVFVDIAGSKQVRASVSEQLGKSLCGVISVGLTHWQDAAYGGGAETFFAPSWSARRMREAGNAFAAQIAQGWLSQVAIASEKLTITRKEGADAVASSFAALVAGTAPADQAWVCSLHAP